VNTHKALNTAGRQPHDRQLWPTAMKPMQL